MKRMLSITLALVLGLLLIIPAIASQSTNMPVITSQPGLGRAMFLQADNDIVLHIGVQAPANSIAMGIEWFVYGNSEPIVGATGNVLTFPTSQDMISGGMTETMRFFARVTNYYRGEDEIVRPTSIDSRVVEVRLVSCPQEATVRLWGNQPLWLAIVGSPWWLLRTMWFFIQYPVYVMLNMVQR